jgi:hypothetical protein
VVEERKKVYSVSVLYSPQYLWKRKKERKDVTIAWWSVPAAVQFAMRVAGVDGWFALFLLYSRLISVCRSGGWCGSRKERRKEEEGRGRKKRRLCMVHYEGG